MVKRLRLIIRVVKRSRSDLASQDLDLGRGWKYSEYRRDPPLYVSMANGVCRVYEMCITVVDLIMRRPKNNYF